jgi:hypothetical protein
MPWELKSFYYFFQICIIMLSSDGEKEQQVRRREELPRGMSFMGRNPMNVATVRGNPQAGGCSHSDHVQPLLGLRVEAAGRPNDLKPTPGDRCSQPVTRVEDVTSVPLVEGMTPQPRKRRFRSGRRPSNTRTTV